MTEWLGQGYRIFIELNFLQHVADIRGHLATLATALDFYCKTALRMSSCQCE